MNFVRSCGVLCNTWRTTNVRAGANFSLCRFQYLLNNAAAIAWVKVPSCVRSVILIKTATL